MIPHFDLLAPWYDRVVRLDISPRLAQALRLPHDGLLLDGGGGTGRSSFPFRSAGGRLVGCDFSLPMLQQARIKGIEDLAQARAESLPFRDGAFDSIMVVDALHHFSDGQGAIREFARVLKPGGRLVIEEPDRRLWAIKLLAILEKMALMHSRIATMPEIVRMAVAEGLTARIETGERWTSWVVCDKKPVHL